MGGLPPIFFVLILADAIQQLVGFSHLLYLLLVYILGWYAHYFF
jgi:hypothetical protein